MHKCIIEYYIEWRDDRAAEGARLESGCILNNQGTKGSNPFLSA